MASELRAARRHPERHAPPLAPGKVVVAWCHPGSVSGPFLDSLYATLLADHHRSDPRLLGPGGGFISISSGPRIVDARTQVIDAFLAVPDIKDAQWLWLLDTDMVFEPDVLYRLLEVAHITERPIVGALAFAGGHSAALFPTVYRLVDHDGPAVEPVYDYPRDQLVKVGATGAACLLVHRQVFMAMAQPHPLGFGTMPDGSTNPHPWFEEGIKRGKSFGEDVAFCMRAQALKFPVHVDTRIKVGHVKPHVLDEALFDSLNTASVRVSA